MAEQGFTIEFRGASREFGKDPTITVPRRLARQFIQQQQRKGLRVITSRSSGFTRALRERLRKQSLRGKKQFVLQGKTVSQLEFEEATGVKQKEPEQETKYFVGFKKEGAKSVPINLTEQEFKDYSKKRGIESAVGAKPSTQTDPEVKARLRQSQIDAILRSQKGSILTRETDGISKLDITRRMEAEQLAEQKRQAQETRQRIISKAEDIFQPDVVTAGKQVSGLVSKELKDISTSPQFKSSTQFINTNVRFQPGVRKAPRETVEVAGKIVSGIGRSSNIFSEYVDIDIGLGARGPIPGLGIKPSLKAIESIPFREDVGINKQLVSQLIYSGLTKEKQEIPKGLFTPGFERILEKPGIAKPIPLSKETKKLVFTTGLFTIPVFGTGLFGAEVIQAGAKIKKGSRDPFDLLTLGLGAVPVVGRGSKPISRAFAKRPFTIEPTKELIKKVKPFSRQRATVFLKTPSGSYLLGRTQSGQAISLGGVIDKGESGRRAALRELREETGLGLKDISNFKFRENIVFPEETFITYTADISSKAIKKIKPKSDIKEIINVSPFKYKGIRGQTGRYPVERGGIRSYELGIMNYLEGGKSPKWLFTSDSLKKYTDSFSVSGLPRFVERVQKRSIRKPSSYVDYLLGKKPGQFKRFGNLYAVGTQSRYDIPYSSQKQYLKQPELLLASGTPNPLAFQRYGLFPASKGTIDPSKTKRGQASGLYVQPPIAPDEAGYLGLSYLGLRGTRASESLGIKFGSPKPTALLFREKTKYPLSPTPKTLSGQEAELIFKEGVIATKGGATRLNISKQLAYLQPAKLVRDPQARKLLDKLNRTKTISQRKRLLSQIEKRTGVDYSQYYGRYKYIPYSSLTKYASPLSKSIFKKGTKSGSKYKPSEIEKRLFSSSGKSSSKLPESNFFKGYKDSYKSLEKGNEYYGTSGPSKYGEGIPSNLFKISSGIKRKRKQRRRRKNIFEDITRPSKGVQTLPSLGAILFERVGPLSQTIQTGFERRDIPIEVAEQLGLITKKKGKRG